MLRSGGIQEAKTSGSSTSPASHPNESAVENKVWWWWWEKDGRSLELEKVT
jgi:hypothetical protein